MGHVGALHQCILLNPGYFLDIVKNTEIIICSGAPCRDFSNFFLKMIISVISVQILVWVSMQNFFFYGKIYLEGSINNQYN